MCESSPSTKAAQYALLTLLEPKLGDKRQTTNHPLVQIRVPCSDHLQFGKPLQCAIYVNLPLFLLIATIQSLFASSVKGNPRYMPRVSALITSLFMTFIRLVHCFWLCCTG
ncbi:hypothetical protein AG1IA_10308 [Rhizoctonia solani AG-1 IA]|uniref:Uncharacterized protein n=1 Tax=Thanatephorus cucumeris (strain AG1-IA) TaxID=983506 RepID=L8WG14_THACA|nr:hypothetical protein AG1IA_10308 [Rhizoctonia solani AG-1 IA]